MKSISDIQAWQQCRASLSPELALGFVPTMGNLHAGHESLLRRSVQENDVTVLSIYVNPTQFDQVDDFNGYPSTLHEDVERARACGVDYVLLPCYEQLYADDFRFRVTEERASKSLEGRRDGHFNGVLTVVMKLLQIVSPQRAYFGEKDYQQYQLIRDMVSAFFMPIDVVPCATVREPAGLAMSSRNHRLTAKGRDMASLLYRELCAGRSAALVSAALESVGIQVDYVVDVDGRRFAAVIIEGVRLIDNVACSELRSAAVESNFLLKE
jgi:pantoate--beta-alanine ligase